MFPLELQEYKSKYEGCCLEREHTTNSPVFGKVNEYPCPQIGTSEMFRNGNPPVPLQFKTRSRTSSSTTCDVPLFTDVTGVVTPSAVVSRRDVPSPSLV